MLSPLIGFVVDVFWVVPALAVTPAVSVLRVVLTVVLRLLFVAVTLASAVRDPVLLPPVVDVGFTSVPLSVTVWPTF